MKHQGFIPVMTIAAMLLMASCSADDAAKGEAPSLQHQTIAFSVSEAATRTAPNTLTLDGSGSNEQSLKTEGFGVFSSHTGLHPYVSSTTRSDLMWNQQVAYNTTKSIWDYNPIVYWPNTDEEMPDYVTFFAYAPYSDGSSDAASACIIDFSLPGETGDPWLVYQLGGTTSADGANGWKARQVDLLYDIQKDQQRPYPPTASKVTFQFRHALACVGDRITLTCSDELQTRLKELSASTGSTVTLTLDRLALDYELTSKAQLVLNGTSSPNWKPVVSGETMVHRYLIIDPEQVIATATSASDCALTDYAVNNQGIFYIPLELGGNSQKLTVRAFYTVSTGDQGKVESTVTLNSVAEAGNGRNLNLTLSIPDL